MVNKNELATWKKKHLRARTFIRALHSQCAESRITGVKALFDQASNATASFERALTCWSGEDETRDRLRSNEIDGEVVEDDLEHHLDAIMSSGAELLRMLDARYCCPDCQELLTTVKGLEKHFILHLKDLLLQNNELLGSDSRTGLFCPLSASIHESCCSPGCESGILLEGEGGAEHLLKHIEGKQAKLARMLTTYELVWVKDNQNDVHVPLINSNAESMD